MEAKMALNAPNMVMYLVALLLAIVGLLAYFGVLGGMIGWAFWLMAIAFVVLALSVLLKAA
jgi:fatty acid desaturase